MEETASAQGEPPLQIDQTAQMLGQRIRSNRQSMNLTFARMSLKAGISKAALEKVERGDTDAPLSFYLKAVWRIDGFATCSGFLSPEGLKERGRSPVDQLMRLCGQRVAQKRASLGLTLQELSAKCGVPQEELMKIEWGSSWGTFADYSRLFEALGEPGLLPGLLR